MREARNVARTVDNQSIAIPICLTASILERTREGRSNDTRWVSRKVVRLIERSVNEIRSGEGGLDLLEESACDSISVGYDCAQGCNGQAQTGAVKMLAQVPTGKESDVRGSGLQEMRQGHDETKEGGICA